MAEEEKKEPETPNPPEPPVEPKPPPAPNYATREDLSSIDEKFAGLSRMMESIQGTFNSLVAARNAGQEVALEDVKPEELEEALQQGKGADKFLKATNAQLQRQLKPIKDAIIQMQTVGTNAIAGLTKDTVYSPMVIGEDKAKLAKKYQKEIDQKISSLPPDVLVNKATYGVVLGSVIADHFDEIIKAEREAVMRQAHDAGGGNTPGTTSGRTQGQGSKSVPTVKEFLGEDAAMALEDKGVSADEFARSLRRGFKGWEDYVAFSTKQEEEVRGQTRGKSH